MFSRKKKLSIHPIVRLNNIPVEKASYQKHLALFPDEKSTFKHHFDNKIRRALPRKSLLTIYKVFLSPLIDYGDIIYDQPYNSSFCKKLESVQHKAALAITGAIKGTPREKIFQELGLESLKSQSCFRRLCCIFKIMKNEAPNYLISLMSKREQTFNTRNKHC